MKKFFFVLILVLTEFSIFLNLNNIAFAAGNLQEGQTGCYPNPTDNNADELCASGLKCYKNDGSNTEYTSYSFGDSPGICHDPSKISSDSSSTSDNSGPSCLIAPDDPSDTSGTCKDTTQTCNYDGSTCVQRYYEKTQKTTKVCEGTCSGGSSSGSTSSQTKPQNGGKCDNVKCQDGYVCQPDNTCVSKGSVSEEQSCVYNEACKSGLVCRPYSSIGGNNGDLYCLQPAKEGEYCDTTADCADKSLVCRYTSTFFAYSCEKPAEKDEQCETDNDCRKGLVCKNGMGSGPADLGAAIDRALRGKGLCESNNGVDEPLSPPPSPPCAKWDNDTGQCMAFLTEFGKWDTEPSFFLQKLFAVLLGISGGIALLLIMRAGYQLLMSQGNPEKVQQAREQLTAAIVGLIFLIFSFVILHVIGVDVLRVPNVQDNKGCGPIFPKSVDEATKKLGGTETDWIQIDSNTWQYNGPTTTGPEVPKGCTRDVNGTKYTEGQQPPLYHGTVIHGSGGSTDQNATSCTVPEAGPGRGPSTLNTQGTCTSGYTCNVGLNKCDDATGKCAGTCVKK